MIWMRILPGVLKELLKHVPTVLFEVVEWNELASEIPKLSRRILKSEGYKELLDYQKTLTQSLGITLSENSGDNKNYLVTKENGEKLLALYFTQIYSEKGLFLDLRSTHFSDSLNFHPSGLWTTFGPSFRKGILEIYEGFYLENDTQFNKGLEGLGIMNPNWSTEEKTELADLFKAQFGSAQFKPMKFDLEHFQKSIVAMTEFLIKKKVKINADFLYLGIYLVTLYSHLDQCQHELPVKDIYLQVVTAQL